MARWTFLYLLIVLIFINEIAANSINNDKEILVKRHIGSAREKLFRAKPNSLSKQTNPFHRQHQTIPSPEVLRARWLELYNQQQKTKQED